MRGWLLSCCLRLLTAASAAAFFCCSRASRVLSATNLPAATRLGFFMRAAVVGVRVVVVACCVISTCECAVWVSPCECVLSDCSVDILKRSVYVKQIKLLCNYSEFVWNCSAGCEYCSGISSHFALSFLCKCELKSMCFAVIKAAEIGARNFPYFKARLPTKSVISLLIM